MEASGPLGDELRPQKRSNSRGGQRVSTAFLPLFVARDPLEIIRRNPSKKRGTKEREKERNERGKLWAAFRHARRVSLPRYQTVFFFSSAPNKKILFKKSSATHSRDSCPVIKSQEGIQVTRGEPGHVLRNLPVAFIFTIKH